MGLQELFAAASATGNVTTPENALNATDGIFTTDTGAKSWTHRWRMKNPASGENQGSGTHTLTVRARASATTSVPTINTIYVRESGVILVQQNVAVGITSGVGQDISFTFSGSLVTNGTAITVEIVTTFGSGSPQARAAVQIDSIKWSGDFVVPTVTPSDLFFQFL